MSHDAHQPPERSSSDGGAGGAYPPGGANPPQGAYPPAGAYPPPGGYPYPPYPSGYRDPEAKSRVVAGVLGILLGSIGVHRFYLGYTGIGVLQIVATIVTCGLAGVWGFVEGIVYLVSKQGYYSVDATGRPLSD